METTFNDILGNSQPQLHWPGVHVLSYDPRTNQVFLYMFLDCWSCVIDWRIRVSGVLRHRNIGCPLASKMIAITA